MNGQEDTEDYKIIGTVCLILAFIVLIGAFTMRGAESWRGDRLALIIFAVALTFFGGFIYFQKGEKKNAKEIYGGVFTA